MKNNKDKRIEKLEAKFEELCRYLKVTVIAEEETDDEGWYKTEVVKRKRHPWA